MTERELLLGSEATGIDPRELYRQERAKRPLIADRVTAIIDEARKELNAMTKKNKLTPAQQKSRDRGMKRFSENAAKRRGE